MTQDGCVTCTKRTEKKKKVERSSEMYNHITNVPTQPI